MKYLLMAMAALGLLACDADEPNTADAGPVFCEYKGKLYPDNTAFPAGDGCNQCFCNPTRQSPGSWECSLIACEGVPCDNDLADPDYCPGHCTQVAVAGEAGVWCADPCEDASECGELGCASDGYCIPTCTGDDDCALATGALPRCDTAVGLCVTE